MSSFHDIFESQGITINRELMERFFLYKDHLLEWNKKINLTAITDTQDIFYKHFLDSLLLTKVNHIDLNKGLLIDVGTGAGFPGVPLALFYKNLSVFLSDSLEKRILFLDSLKTALKIENATLLSGRSELLGRDVLWRESFDFATARAVSSLPVILELLSPFVKKGGYIICYKGPGFEEELKNAEKAIKELSLELVSVDKFIIREANMSRVIIVFTKNNVISELYPRRPGVPQKKPLL